MLEIDFGKMDTAVTEYQRRQTKMVTAMAWLLVQQGMGVAAALRSLGIKPTRRWMQMVSGFGGEEDIEK